MSVFDNVPRQERGRTIVAALCWIASLEFVAAQFIARLAWPAYSIRDHDISFLGITTCGPFTDPATGQVFEICSPLHDVLNGGIIVLGLLHLVGAILSRHVWGNGRVAQIGLVLVAVSSAGPVAAGLWPANENLVLHGVGALLGLVVGSVGIVVLGTSMLRRHVPFGLFSIVCGLVSIVGFLLYGSGVYLEIGRGGMERVASSASTVWFVVAGIALLVSARRSHEAPSAELEEMSA